MTFHPNVLCFPVQGQADREMLLHKATRGEEHEECQTRGTIAEFPVDYLKEEGMAIRSSEIGLSVVTAAAIQPLFL